MSSESDQGQDEDLDEYYKELGIDPEEMREPNKQKKQQAVYLTKPKRSEVLTIIMERARTQPNYKILNRVIQVTKQIF